VPNTPPVTVAGTLGGAEVVTTPPSDPAASVVVETLNAGDGTSVSVQQPDDPTANVEVHTHTTGVSVSTTVEIDTVATPKNIVLVTIENTGIANLSAYDDINRWPSGHVYASMPWLDAKIADGIRYTNFRGHATASSTRSSILTGRVPHRTASHDGTGYGDEPVSSGVYAGLGPSYFPLPFVLKRTDASYDRQLFGQFDLGESTFGNADWGFAVTGTGFSKSSIQKHFEVENWAYKPGMLYDDFPEYIKDGTAALVTTASVTSPILPAKTAERVIDYFGSLTTSDPFIASWDISYCEELFPAFDQTETVDGSPETLHTTFTLGQLHASATGYGSVSNTNLGWRRPIAMRETVDALLQLAENALPAAVAANTIWVIMGASGSRYAENLPRDENWTSGTDGRTVQPPTVDGTTSTAAANTYYSPWHEGVYEPSTRVPLVIAGAIPAASKGSDCTALIEAADIYPTVLEILTGEAWKEPLNNAGAYGQLDGESFAHTLDTPGAAHREHVLSELVTPAGTALLTSGSVTWSIALVNDAGWKFTAFSQAGSGSTSYYLYDLNTDPDEEANLYPPTTATEITQYNDLLAEYTARTA